MAFERSVSDKNKVRGDSLDVFVSNLSRTFYDQMTVRNAEEEAKFQNSVLEDNLSMDDQLAYRKQQLKDVSDDPKERARVRAEIAGLKDRIEQKKFTDDYTKKVIEYNSGASSVDSVLTWLQDQLASATDQTVIDTINVQLAQKQSEKFTLTQSMLKDQTDFAITDKTDSVLGAQLSRVQAARASALLAGNSPLVAALDLQVQALSKAQTEASVQRNINNFAVASISGYATATKLLDSYNSKIAGSAATGPVTIGGTTYDSEQQFWTFKRDTYLSDNSASGFFPQITAETNSTIKTLSSQNLLNKDTLSSSVSAFTDLSNRPELAHYTTQISNARQTALQDGADLVATKVIENNYTNTLDINKAIADLTALKTLGVNVEDSYAKILGLAASTKTAQVNGILSAAQNAMLNNPGLTAEQAIQQAVAAGAGTVISPNQAATQTESQIASAGASTLQAGTGANDPRTTVAQPTPTSTPAGTPPAPATPAAVQPVTTPTSSSAYTIKYGDTLSAIAAAHSTTIAAIAQANGITDPNKITAGATLKIPAATSTTTATATPTPTSTPVATPAPAATTPTATKVTAPAAPAPTPTPAPAPSSTPPSSSYTFTKDGTNVVVFNNGVRVSTTTADNARINYGYTG